jgi:hypothetical protein
MHRVLCGVVAALLATGLTAQAAAPVRIRGTIAAVKDNSLTINTRSGSKITLELTPDYTVGTVAKASLSDIKADDYIGATTVPNNAGDLVALEVHIFPPAGRGTGEGSRPYDLAPNSTMTNAAVTGDVKSTKGRKLTLTYHGGQKTIIVTPSTPVVFTSAGSHADVKAGVGIVVNAATQNPDGTYRANRITVGKDGVNPPQ